MFKVKKNVNTAFDFKLTKSVSFYLVLITALHMCNNY